MNALGSPQSLLVLGGTSEIAQAVASRLVGDRVRTVALAGRDPEALERAAERLRGTSAATVSVHAFDASDTTSHEQLVSDLFETQDWDVVLVAFGQLGDAPRTTPDVDRAIELATVNYVGAVSVGLRVAERMTTQGHGVIVVLSSVAGERPRASNYVYGSSKAGLDAFATGLGDALHGTGVRVMVVRPGFVRTRMTQGLEEAPLAATADEVADAVVDGLRRGKQTVWVPGKLRVVMSGLRHLPRPVFRRLDL